MIAPLKGVGEWSNALNAAAEKGARCVTMKLLLNGEDAYQVMAPLKSA